MSGSTGAPRAREETGLGIEPSSSGVIRRSTNFQSAGSPAPDTGQQILFFKDDANALERHDVAREPQRDGRGGGCARSFYRVMSFAGRTPIAALGTSILFSPRKAARARLAANT